MAGEKAQLAKRLCWLQRLKLLCNQSSAGSKSKIGSKSVLKNRRRKDEVSLVRKYGCTTREVGVIDGDGDDDDRIAEEKARQTGKVVGWLWVVVKVKKRRSAL